MNKTRNYIAAALASTAVVLATAPLVVAATKSKTQIRQEVAGCEKQWSAARERCSTLKGSAAQKEQCVAAGWTQFETCVEGVEKGLSRTLKRPAGLVAPARGTGATKQAGQQTAAAAQTGANKGAAGTAAARKPTPSPTPRASWIVPGARQTGSHIR